MKNLIRFGKVSSVDAEKCTARVVFDDHDGLVSAELPVLQTSCMNNQFYSLPDVNSDVVALMTPNSNDGTGFILGSFFTNQNPPPAQVQDISMIKFGDGTTISYNRESHELNVNCVGNVYIRGKNIYLND